MEGGTPVALATHEADSDTPASQRVRLDAILASCFVAAALAPVLVLLVARWGVSYTPAGDSGLLDLRVRDVWSLDIPLSGPYSVRGWNHPGPLLHYLLAIPSALTGQAAWGTQVGGVLLQGVAVGWLAWLAWRRGGLPMVAAAMVGASLLWHAQGALTLRDPWNPSIALPFFALFVFQSWLLATGDPRQLPWTVAVGSLLVHSHVGYLPFVIACAAVVAMFVLVDRRSGSPRPPGGWRRRLRWSLAVGVVLWIPPVLDTVLHPPGNLWRVARYFVHAPDGLERVGVGYATRLVAREFSFDATWARGPETFLFIPVGRSVVLLVLPAVLVGAALVVANRRRDAAGMRFVTLAAVLLVTGIMALSRVDGELMPYQYMWRPALAVSVTLGTGWVMLSPAVGRRPWLRRTGLAVAALVVVTASGSLAVELADVAGTESGAERATSRIVAELVRRGVPEGGVILRFDRGSPVQLQRGIYDELRRRGEPVFVDEELEFQFGPGTGRQPSSVARVWWVTDIGSSLTEALAQQGAQLIASSSPLSPRDEARARELSAHLHEQFVAIGRPDLVVVLDSQLLPEFTKDIDGIDHSAAAELGTLADRRIRRGGPRAGVVSFPPEAAPADLTSR